DLPRALLVASQPGRTEAAVLMVAGLIVLALVRHELRGDGLTRRRAWVRIVALLGLVAYAALPYSLYDRDRVTYGLFILYQRFASFLPLVLLPTFAGPARFAWRRGLALAVVVAHVSLALHWNRVLHDVGEQARGLDATIDAMQPGRRLKSLVYAPFPR